MPTGAECARRYRRRTPEEGVLFRVLDEHLGAFLECTSEGLPLFVEREIVNGPG